MRVIAGAFKGRRLQAPAWPGLRPTSDRLRETLFNILAPRIAGAQVLDGYAGTGAVGIEALSRGAAHVTFVEQDRRAQALVTENLAHCGISERYAIIRAGVAPALERLRIGGSMFDLVLLDPPYAEAPDAVLGAAGEIVAPGGLVVLEHARRRHAPESAGRLTRVREVGAGDSALSFFELCRPSPSTPAPSIP